MIEEELRKEIERLKSDNARLGACIAEMDTIGRYSGKDGEREWWTGGCWLMPGDAIAHITPTKGITALGDMLAPTIKAISLAEQWMARPKHGMPDRQAIVLALQNELTRLRSITKL